MLFSFKSQYVAPPDMETRNRELIQTVENDLFDKSGKTAFIRFADLSRRYRYKQINATAYLEGLIGLLNVNTVNQNDDDSKLLYNGFLFPLKNL